MKSILLFSPILFNCHAMAQGQISPDGKWMVSYESVDSTNTEIFLNLLDGSKRTRLTYHPFQDYNPEWTPNGKGIVFYRNQFGSTSASIFLFDLDTQEELLLINSKYYASDPSLSINGQLSISSNEDGDHEIFISDMDDQSLTQLTKNGASDWTPSWSPDGSKITFISDRTGHFEIYTMNRDGSDVRSLTSAKSECYCPNWSPDGKSIAYFTRKKTNSKFDLAMVSPITGSITFLTETEDTDEFIIGWSPDTKHIIYSMGDEVWSVNVASLEVRKLF